MQLKNEFNQTQEEINFLHRFHQRRCQSECGGSALCLFQRNQLGEHLRALPMPSVMRLCPGNAPQKAHAASHRKNLRLPRH
jgi:hypothetical protein